MGAAGRISAIGALALVMTGATAPVAQAADQRYYWRWSDGSTSAARSFAQSVYGLPANLPRILVSALPRRAGQSVALQFWRHGRWVTESVARTGTDGVASIDADPLCARGTWCERTFEYRLLVGGQDAELAITFSAT